MEWKTLFVLVVIVAVVCAEENSLARKRKKHKFGFGLFPGYLYKSGILAYVAFIAIKVKIIVAIAIFTAAMAFGMKALAAVKYAKNIFGSCHDGAVFSHPSGFEHEYIPSGTIEYSSYPGSPEDSYGPPKMPHTESSYDKYGRNMDAEIEADWDKSLKRIIKRMDITEYAFDSMNMSSEECRRKFVCEIDQISRRNSLLGFGLQFFADQGLNRYRNDTMQARNFRECSKIYLDCPS